MTTPTQWRRAGLVATWLMAGLISPAMGQVSDVQKPVVRIGSKKFTESIILGEMLAHLARDAGADVEHARELGGTTLVFNALESDGIDIYPEYTGTLIAEVLREDSIRNDDELQAALAKRGLAIGGRLGFNNTYAIGLKEETTEKLGLTKISDLADAKHARLKLGFSEEFMNRGDGWPGLARQYRLPQQPKVLDHDLAYRGIESGSIQATDLYSTDAEARYYKLRLLEDDRGYFPQYHCVLLYRLDFAQRLPRVLESMRRMEGQINNIEMIEMNAQAKIDRVHESRVAADYLRTKLGVEARLDPKLNQSRWRQAVGNLWLTTRQHLFLVAVSLAAAIMLSVPLGIWAYKYPPLAQAILGVVGIIQTIPSMAVLVFMIPLLGLGPWSAIVALFLYSLLPIVRGTLTGLREIPGHLKESAIVLGLPARARLWMVELPMASRSILSGIKTAAVINVGTATIGALIGAGGYGQPILTGIRLNDLSLILQGAIPAAVLALMVQAGFDLLEPLLVPRGLRLAAGKE